MKSFRGVNGGMDMTLALPLLQSPEFGRAARALGLPLRTFRRECAGRTTLVAQAQSRRLGPLGMVDLVSRGPVAASSAEALHWLHRHTARRAAPPLLLNAAGIAPASLREVGFWPMVTPATLALLPLGPPGTMRATLRQKWRNRLNRAEDAALLVRKTDLVPGHWLLAAEAAQARARRYRGLPPGLCAAFAVVNPGGAQVFEARRGGETLAAALMLRHGRMATWQIGVSLPEGRRHNAMNLLLWHAMTELAADGVETLDLGCLNTDDAPGLAHFKLGTGAVAQRLSGTWLHLAALAPLARRLPERLAA